MKQISRIVVHDPSGEYWEGSLVDAQQEAVLRARGVVTLPVDADLFRRAGVGGYMRRSWGAGWPLESIVSRYVCPLTIYMETENLELNWALRLVTDPGAPDPVAGQFSIVTDPTQTGGRTTVTPEKSAVLANELGAKDKDGGWTIYGRSKVQPASNGFYGFAVYGTMPGARVAWAAISVA